jgi:hypothetical protein
VKGHLPLYAEVVSVDTPSGASWDSGDKTWTIEHIEVGGRMEFGIVVKFNSSKLALRNCASIVHADQDDHDSTPENFNWVPAGHDESCADASQIDLELTKTVSDENPTKGDENGNGVNDAGEPGLANVIVNLISPGPDGIFGTTDDVIEAATVTTANGGYWFTDIPEGPYRVDDEAEVSVWVGTPPATDAICYIIDPVKRTRRGTPGTGCPNSLLRAAYKPS